MEEYNSVTSEFLDMIRDIHFKEGKKETEQLSSSEWTDELKQWTNNDKIKTDDRINNQTLFRYNIDKYVVSDRIAEFQIIKGRTGRKRYVQFIRIEEEKETYNVDDEIELSNYYGNSIVNPQDDNMRKDKIISYRARWELAMFDGKKEVANKIENLMIGLFRNGDMENWNNITKPNFMKILSSGDT